MRSVALAPAPSKWSMKNHPEQRALKLPINTDFGTHLVPNIMSITYYFKYKKKPPNNNKIFYLRGNINYEIFS